MASMAQISAATRLVFSILLDLIGIHDRAEFTWYRFRFLGLGTPPGSGSIEYKWDKK